MVDVLEEAGPYTLFAPTNAAFTLIKEDQLNYLQSEEVGLYLTHYITSLPPDIMTRYHTTPLHKGKLFCLKLSFKWKKLLDIWFISFR